MDIQLEPFLPFGESVSLRFNAMIDFIHAAKKLSYYCCNTPAKIHIFSANKYSIAYIFRVIYIFNIRGSAVGKKLRIKNEELRN
jgi:hypothetical protein